MFLSLSFEHIYQFEVLNIFTKRGGHIFTKRGSHILSVLNIILNFGSNSEQQPIGGPAKQLSLPGDLN